MANDTEQLIQQANRRGLKLWRGKHSQLDSAHRSTGYSELDQQLQLGGWPLSGSCELLLEHYGIGEWQLISPALMSIVEQQGHIAWLNPPYCPNPPAWSNSQAWQRHLVLHERELNKQLWILEEALSSGAFSTVLSWLTPRALQFKHLRRLHLAALQGRCWHINVCPSHFAKQSSPAPLRLALSSSAQGRELAIDIIKQPGKWAGQHSQLAANPALHFQQPAGKYWLSGDAVKTDPIHIQWPRHWHETGNFPTREKSAPTHKAH